MNRKRSFLLSYMASAVLGTALVFFGTPLVRANIPEDRLEAMRTACLSDTPLAGLWTAIVAPRESSEVVPDRAPGTQPRIPRRSRHGAERLASAQMAPRTGIEPAPAVPHSPTTSAANGNGLTNGSYDYTRMWGIVTNDPAIVYSRTGDKVTELGAGSVIEVADVKTTRSERLAICRYYKQPESLTLALIRASDIQLRTGCLGAANPELVELLARQARLQQGLAAARTAHAAELNRANPAFARYDKARRECLEFNERLASLKARFDKAQGAARSELLDNLRAMKDEGAELARTHEDAKREFESWAAAHPQTVSDTPATTALVAELAALQRQVRELDR